MDWSITTTTGGNQVGGKWYTSTESYPSSGAYVEYDFTKIIKNGHQDWFIDDVIQEVEEDHLLELEELFEI